MTMPFGRHKGRPLHELPDDYLAWLTGIELREPLLSAVHRERERRVRAHRPVLLAPCPNARLADELVDVGARVLAKRAHPDAGGSHDAFVELQAVREWLREIVQATA